MPRRKSPATLRRIGLETLGILVGSLRTTKLKGNEWLLCRTEWELYFAQCPGIILEDLIELLHWQQPSGIDCSQLETLLCSNLRRLWLHYSDSKSLRNIPLGFKRILRRLSTFGTQITDLSLKGCILWNNEELIQMLESLQGLRRLVLYSSKLDDEVLKTIGSSCCQLEELHISGWSITDAGLTSLTTSPPPLKVLVVDTDRNYSPKITRGSVINLIQKLPLLEILRIPCLSEALLYLDELCPESSINLRLYDDDLNGEAHTEELMTAITCHCPLLTDIKVNSTNSKALLTLKDLHNLTSLAVSSVGLGQSAQLFISGLAPVLEAIGGKITRLEISLEEIDLTILDQCCPLLTELECLRVTRIRKSDDNYKQHFQYLKCLKLFSGESNSIKRDDLLYLLSGCYNLETLFVGWCDALNDHTIQLILRKNPLINLRELEISDISSVTVNGLQLLLLSESDLQMVNILSCDSISLHDIDILRNLICALNLEVKIKYYE